ncbi:hypothetical protein [Variovorax sp.]|uniref:hypothetical protein n=1 Tax=Variovorax sp. TaxID=1871043 RepID=UPI002D57600A|nr:hypothetical protein [Variovorax sp.]HYP83509.1 hypothetical protein [Variovorax sp.]
MLNRNGLSGRSACAAVAAPLLLVLPCIAGSSVGTDSASVRVTLRVVVPPVFNILRVERVAGGYRYHVWTNMPSAHFNGRLVHFDHVGESTMELPTPPDALYVAPGL